jgi:hypothetical protein
MERRFHVVFTGQLHSGFSHDETVEKMVLLFQLDRPKVAKLLSSGRPTIMKQGLSYEQARKYKGHLEQIGLRMSVIEADAQIPPPSIAISPRTSPKPSEKKPLPKSPVALGPTVLSNAPPAAPKAKEPAVEPESPDDTPAEEVRMYSGTPPFRIGRSHGWLWIKEAFGILFKQPFKWAAMTTLTFFMTIPVAVVPFGGLLTAVLIPIFQGGIMLGAQHQMEGEGLRIAHLFHGFRHFFPQLLLVGFLYLLGVIGQMIVLILCINKIMSGISGIHQNTPGTIIAFFQSFPLDLLGLLIIMAISIPLMMGLWFAPCLVSLDDRTALTGFRLSFLAVRINFFAFLIYGMVFLLLGLLFIFLYGAIAALFSFLLGSDHSFLFMLLPMLSMLLLGILLATIIPLSIYTGYRDIFHGREKQPVGE